MTHLIDRRCAFRPTPARLSRPVGVLCVLALAGAWLVPAPTVRAQVTHASPIPNDVKTSANALTSGQTTVIGKFIDGEIANLKSGKTENEKAARKALEDAAVAAGGTPSVGYLGAYASALNTKLVQLAKTQPPLQVRLNAAIVVAHVAAKADNTMLKDAATTFALDDAEPVALWGVKAGKYLVPHLLEPGQSGTLDAAIIRAVEKFKSDSAIVEDAYDDFTGDLIEGGSPPAPPERGAKAIDPLLQLMEQRASLYEKAQNPTGADPELPAEPEADNRGYSFIARPAVWKSAKPLQQQQMCRAGIDLLTQIIPLIDVTPARVPTVDPPEVIRRENLIAVINQAGSAFTVIGSLTSEGSTGPIATAASMLTAAKVSALTPGSTLKARLATLEAALTAANLMAPVPKPASPVPLAPPVRPVPTSPTTLPGAHPVVSRPTPTGAH